MRDIDFLHKMKLIDSWYSMIQIPDGRENSTFLQEIMNTNGVEQTDITMFYILSVYRCISNMEAYVNNIRTIKKAMGQKWFAGLINGYHSLIPTTLYGQREYISEGGRFGLYKNGTVDLSHKQMWFDIEGQRYSIEDNARLLVVTTGLRDYFGDDCICVKSDSGLHLLHVDNNRITGKEKLEDKYTDRITLANRILIEFH